jgi:hypothetical protein
MTPAEGLQYYEDRLQRLRLTSSGEAIWLLSVAALLALHVAALLPAFARPESIDFTAFVQNARAWLDGHPYAGGSRDPNAPHVILAFVPFVYLSPSAGVIAWTAISYACMAATLLMVTRVLDIRPSAPLALTGLALLLGSRPVADVFVNANMIWPFALVMTLAWRCARRGDVLRAAALLGVLASAKPFLGGFFLLFVARRWWGALLAMAAAAAGTLGISVVIAGAAAFEAWIEAIGRISWYDAGYNGSIMGLLARVWRPHPGLWLAASIAVAAVTYVQLKRTYDTDREWLATLLASLLIAPLGWRYYLCFVVGPVVGCVLRSVRSPSLWGAIVGLAVAPALLPGPSVPSRATAGSLVFLATLIAWGVVLRGRGRDNAGAPTPSRSRAV